MPFMLKSKIGLSRVPIFFGADIDEEEGSFIDYYNNF